MHAAKLNGELQTKTEMLMELSSHNFKTQNEELQRKNKELEIKEGTYNSLK